MSKKIISFLAALFIANTAFAGGPIAIKSLTDIEKIPAIARVERSFELGNFASGRLHVIETDNGGSTDISSMLYPSEAYLTWFQGNEIINIAAVFDLGGVKRVDRVRKKAKDTYVIEGIFWNEDAGKHAAGKIQFNLSGLHKAIDNLKNAQMEEFTTYYLNGEITAIGVQGL